MMNPETDRWTLRKDGFTDMIVRKRLSGIYEWLAYKSFHSDRWEEITLPIEIIERDIAEWGIKDE